jgi:hypothetical protein
MKDPFRNFDTYKIDPLTEIRNAGIVTNGQVYWVSSESDSDHRGRTNDLGNSVVKTGLNAAISAAKTNANDYILVIPTDGGTVRPLGTAVDINKHRLHILGVGYKPVPQTYGGLTFQGYVAATGIDTELVNVSGAAVELGGLRFLGTSGTAALGTVTGYLRIGTASTGTPHDFWAHDVQVENNQAADPGGTAQIVDILGNVAGGITGLRFDRCWFGNSSWAPTGVVVMAGTAGPTRSEYHDCTFVMDAQATTDSFVVMGTGATGYTKFKDCEFINVEAGTLVASVFTGAVLVDNPVLLRNCSYVNVSAAGTDSEVFKSPAYSGTAAAITDVGIAIGTAAIIPA